MEAETLGWGVPATPEIYKRQLPVPASDRG